MKEVHVLIADGDPHCLKRNAEQLGGMSGIHIVGTTMDGYDLIRKVKNQMVDVVLTDLMLKSVDGLGVLEAIGSMTGRRPKTLVLSHMCRDFMVDRALSLGASYYMLKPAECELVYKRICLLAEEESGEEANAGAYPGARETISRALREMGISPHMKGSCFLQEGALMCLSDRMLLKNLTGRLYPEIAKRFSTTALSVERNMRTSIGTAWNNGGFLRYAAVSGNQEFAKVRPSAGKLIEGLCALQRKEWN